MNQIQALRVIEGALSAAIANGTFKNIHEVDAVLQSFAVLSQTIQKNDDVQENFKKP